MSDAVTPDGRLSFDRSLGHHETRVRHALGKVSRLYLPTCRLIHPLPLTVRPNRADPFGAQCPARFVPVARDSSGVAATPASDVAGLGSAVAAVGCQL
jgi:hypothetical protein